MIPSCADTPVLAGKGEKKKVYIETYGCQMNVYDSEIVAGLLEGYSYELTDRYEEADAIFLNTCAIRENAEQRVWGQLTRFKQLKEKKPQLVIGVLGCMAKHMEEEIHEKRPYVNVVLGPDSYRRLPEFLDPVIPSHAVTVRGDGFPLDEYADVSVFRMDTRLSRTEVYDAIAPSRFGKTSAWIAVMRGCDNFCTFCVVPYTRGRERSRRIESVIDEVRKAVDQGYTEIGLLGQNVNSYRDGQRDFADLMAAVSDVEGVRRVRFTSPHPKDFPEHLLTLIAGRDNLCKHLHMPVQSGSNRILELMNRTYTREEYLELIERTRSVIPDVAITTDVIVGFPTETDRDHADTLDLYRRAQFDAAFTFAYSPRQGTKAHLMNDDVSADVKKCRLQDVITLQKELTLQSNRREVGRVVDILVEDVSRKSDDFLTGRTDKNQVVVVPSGDLHVGQYARVAIRRAEGYTLFGEVV